MPCPLAAPAEPHETLALRPCRRPWAPPLGRREREAPTIAPEQRAALSTDLAWAARLGESAQARTAADDYLRRRGTSSPTAVRAGLAFAPCCRFATRSHLDEFGLADLRAAGGDDDH
jgi:hypothetical protein